MEKWVLIYNGKVDNIIDIRPEDSNLIETYYKKNWDKCINWDDLAEPVNIDWLYNAETNTFTNPDAQEVEP